MIKKMIAGIGSHLGLLLLNEMELIGIDGCISNDSSSFDPNMRINRAPVPELITVEKIECDITEDSDAQNWVPLKKFTRKCRKGVNIPGQACRGPPEAIANHIIKLVN